MSVNPYSFNQKGIAPLNVFYPAPNCQTPGSDGGTFADDILWMVPFISPRGGAIDLLGLFLVGTGAAGAKGRVGLFDANSDTDLSPNNVLADTGDMPLDAGMPNRHVMGTVNVTLSPEKLYWVAILLSGFGGGVLASNIGFDSWPIMGYTPDEIAGNFSLAIPQPYGPILPTPPMSPTFLNGGNGAPTGFVHYKS